MTWIQATSQQMSPTPRHWPFLRAFGEKGLRLEHKALEFSQKAEERELEGRREWIGLIAELEGVLVRQVGENERKHRCHSAEHLLILLLLKGARTQRSTIRTSWLLNICLSLCFSRGFQRDRENKRWQQTFLQRVEMLKQMSCVDVGLGHKNQSVRFQRRCPTVSLKDIQLVSSLQMLKQRLKHEHPLRLMKQKSATGGLNLCQTVAVWFWFWNRFWNK